MYNGLKSGLALLALAASCCASAQTYPSRPIRVLVTQPAGAASDLLVRLIGEPLGKALGQSIVVENRPGAGGNIAGEATAKSPADGYTLMLASISSHAVNTSIYAKMPYDPVKDFTPVISVASSPNVLIVDPAMNVNSVSQLITPAKAQPAKLMYASAGSGTSHHLAGALFNQLAGIDVVHVPYKGAAEAVLAVMKGEVNYMFPNAPNAIPQAKAGKVKMLAVTTPKRISWLPELPTMAEAGVPGFEVVAWFGLVAPAGTPAPVVQRLNGEIRKIMEMPAVRETMNNQGFEVIGGTPESFGANIRSEVAKWAKVTKAAGIKVE